jgi:hypothetical protein
MNRSIVRALSAAAALLLAVAGAVEAQGVTTGALSGTVSDSMGAPIAGATVEVRFEPTGFRAVTTTNSRGFYLLQGLGPTASGSSWARPRARTSRCPLPRSRSRRSSSPAT